MTIAQSVLSLSLGRHDRRRLAETAVRPSNKPLQCSGPVGMTCEPWGGLYLQEAEVARPTDAQ